MIAPNPMQQPAPPQALTQEQLDMLNKPTWEEVDVLLKNNVHRNFRIDVETDSTVADSIDSDMAGLKDVLAGITQFTQGVGPAIQSGAFPAEAAKEIIMTIARRAKLGTAVEDALDKIKAPEPAVDPNAAKFEAEKLKMQMQMEMQKQTEANKQAAEQQRIAAEMQLQEKQAQLDAEVEQNKQAAQAQQNEHQNQLESARQAQQMQNDAALEQMRIASDERVKAMEENFLRWKEELQAAVKIEIAQIGAKAKMQDAATDAATNEISTEVQQ